jgi:hypothetical protein
MNTNAGDSILRTVKFVDVEITQVIDLNARVSFQNELITYRIWGLGFRVLGLWFGFGV